MTAIKPDGLALSLPTGHDGDPLADEATRLLAARGATVVAIAAGRGEDRRLSRISTFPPAAALSVTLAQQRGLNPDSPSWTALITGPPARADSANAADPATAATA
jgi:hypothetical protein